MANVPVQERRAVTDFTPEAVTVAKYLYETDGYTQRWWAGSLVRRPTSSRRSLTSNRCLPRRQSVKLSL